MTTHTRRRYSMPLDDDDDDGGMTAEFTLPCLVLLGLPSLVLLVLACNCIYLHLNCFCNCLHLHLQLFIFAFATELHKFLQLNYRKFCN